MDHSLTTDWGFQQIRGGTFLGYLRRAGNFFQGSVASNLPTPSRPLPQPVINEHFLMSTPISISIVFEGVLKFSCTFSGVLQLGRLFGGVLDFD